MDNEFQERLKREKEARKAKRKRKKRNRGTGRAAFVENYEFPPKRKGRRKSKVLICSIAYAAKKYERVIT